MAILSIEVSDPQIPSEPVYSGQWASEATVRQSGEPHIWLPLRDINGLSEAITALHRLHTRSHAEALSPAQRSERLQLLTLCIKLLTAERELLLREFAKLLGHALAKTTEPSA